MVANTVVVLRKVQMEAFLKDTHLLHQMVAAGQCSFVLRGTTHSPTGVPSLVINFFADFFHKNVAARWESPGSESRSRFERVSIGEIGGSPPLLVQPNNLLGGPGCLPIAGLLLYC